MSGRLLDAIRSGVRTIDLGRPLFQGMPQSANHPAFTHTYPRRHGDMVRADGGSAANDMISTGTHVGTHIDALSHVSHDGRLFGGVVVEDAMKAGKFTDLGIHTLAPIFRRGVLIDVPSLKGVETLDGGYEITPDDLEAAVERQGTVIEPGDVVLINSGWGRRFTVGREAYGGGTSGVPGVGEEGAYWLAEHHPYAVGADTIAFERLAPGAGHALLPAHRVLLVERGIYIIEALDLEELVHEAVFEFAFVLSPLKIVGGTGSPVRPFAVVESE